MEDGRITDDQITASSQWGNVGTLSPRLARLNRLAQSGTGGAWCSNGNSANQWIQVNLGNITMVTGVMLQGRQDYGQWVTEYKVQYGNDGENWNYVLDDDLQIKVMTNTYVICLNVLYCVA